MDTFSDSGELYTIRNQFYTNQHHKVKSYSLDAFSPENQLKVLEFQIRSTVALGQDASSLIDEGKVLFPDNEQLFQLLSAWNDLKSFGTDDSTYFDDVKEATFELQAVLTTLYLVRIEKDIDQAIVFLSTYIESKADNYIELEPYLIITQLYLVKGNFTGAIKVFDKFQKFPDFTRDSIIYQVLESWILSIKGESDNISSAYYFYDELLSSDFDDDPQGKFKILNVLLVLELKLKHYPEAKELVAQLEALATEPNGDFIANQVTFDYVDNNGENVSALLEKLASVDPDHQLLVDLKEKNERFDGIVQKYSV